MAAASDAQSGDAATLSQLPRSCNTQPHGSSTGEKEGIPPAVGLLLKTRSAFVRGYVAFTTFDETNQKACWARHHALTLVVH